MAISKTEEKLKEFQQALKDTGVIAPWRAESIANLLKEYVDLRLQEEK
jgi:hypothetical protein